MGKDKVAKPDSYLQYPLLFSLLEIFRPHTFLSKTDCKDFFLNTYVDHFFPPLAYSSTLVLHQIAPV